MRIAYSMGRKMNPGEVALELDITIGAAGVVSSVRGYGLNDAVGVRGVLHPATGRYTLTLDQAYGGAVMGVYCGVRQATGVARLFPFHVSGDATAGNEVITIEVLPGTGTTLTDPASGDHLYVTIVIDEFGQVQ